MRTRRIKRRTIKKHEVGGEHKNLGGGRGAGEGGGDAAIGSAIMQQRAWEGAPAGNLKEKLGEPGKMDLWKGQGQEQALGGRF